MKLDEIKDLIQFLEKESKCTRFRLKKGDFEVDLEKDKGVYVERSVQEQPVEVAPEPAVKMQVQEQKGTFITAPMVGTFYDSPSPEDPSFVKVGDSVDENTVVCIVEAMKVMNEVKAGKKGVIAEVYAENSQPVEYGSKLFRIE